MSDIVERTFASFPRLLSSALVGGGRGGHPRQNVPSQSFQTLLKAVDSARGHSEEVAVVHRELSRIKEQFEQPETSVSRWSEAFPRIIFCSVLGYNVSFCHIYAIKLAAQGKGRDKRLGYLAATLLLDPSQEITIMMMGTLMRDLHSSNILDNLMALCAAGQLVSMEHIPLMLPPIVSLLQHKQAVVRAKAVYCIHSFFRRAPSLMQQVLPTVKSMLGDKDPGVLSAVVTLMASLVEQNRGEFASLGMDLINILQQIRERRFPKTFNYSGIPLPWLQIQLLKTLAQLGSADETISTALVPVLSQLLSDFVPRNTISLAILDESILTIAALTKLVSVAARGQAGGREEGCGDSRALLGGETSVHTSEMPTNNNRRGASLEMPVASTAQQELKSGRMAKFAPLLEEASKYLACFLESDDANLRYLGVKALTQLVRVNAELAVHHQKAVVQCLDDPDFIVRQQTLTLLHHMANPANVKVICSKMLEHIHNGDSRLEEDVVDMVVNISGRLAPDPEWYLQTLLPLVSLRLSPARLSSMMDNMLQFLTRASGDPLWPAFPRQLFSTMVGNVMSSQSRSGQALRFCLRTLRFVSLPVNEEFSGDGFLKACGGLVEMEEEKVEVKEQVVLCVQALLLRGCLDKQAVSQWVASLVVKCGPSTPHQYKQKLLELHRLASLQAGLSSLCSQRSSGQMDFTLSFLDSYAKEMCSVSKPLLSIPKPVGPAAVDESVLAQYDEQLSVSHNSSSTRSNQEDTAGHAGSSEHVGSSVEEGVSLSSPAVKQLWSREGFAGSLAEGGEEGNSSNTPLDKDEELARALFQGLSRNQPTSLSTSSSSLVSVTSASQTSPMSVGSSWVSCPSPMVTSSQDTLLASASNLSSSPSREDASPEYPAVSSIASSTPHIPPVSGWKALHLAHSSAQVTDSTETEHHLSDFGSGSNLSISDDSLENKSVQNSPARQPLPPSPLCNTGTRPAENDVGRENTMDQFLETQMAEYESNLTAAERPPSRGESMYSECEILAQLAGEWEELGDGETKNRTASDRERGMDEREWTEDAQEDVEKSLEGDQHTKDR